MTARRVGTLAVTALLLTVLVGCSAARHRARESRRHPAPVVSSTVASSTVASSTVSTIPARGDGSPGLDAVNADLSAVGAAASQADDDVSAAAAAEAQHDDG